ncbi:hypothetical protein Palpr_2109 [Paludibacter propionicigenes WB4]|uniref:Uncharacterized protein n=1 Tax=Paludibacter propionicigenes (strain DSM 17365 / JCM 13257 / WB4) TaxID=694427 RepID=E4T6A1_PALPW|nr:hypothetical protein [Paludibacter propionicigenes]ADQ80245.1 hypothetical protein Palpr_2109 [Paludibacter propionicigenes WB4]
MRRFLSYCLVAVTLFIGVTYTFTSFRKGFETNVSGHNQKALPTDQERFTLSAADILLSVGVGNEQVRISNAFQQITNRVLSSSANTLRLIRSAQLIHLRISTGYTLFLLKSSFKQLDGYYLYHLRKLLI